MGASIFMVYKDERKFIFLLLFHVLNHIVCSYWAMPLDTDAIPVQNWMEENSSLPRIHNRQKWGHICSLLLHSELFNLSLFWPLLEAYNCSIKYIQTLYFMNSSSNSLSPLMYPMQQILEMRGQKNTVLPHYREFLVFLGPFLSPWTSVEYRNGLPSF